MNKAQLVEKLVEKTGLKKKDAEKALNAYIDVTQEALANGEKIQLVGFGTMEVRERAARQGRNPQNPEQIINIPAKKTVVFKPGKGLKAEVNA